MITENPKTSGSPDPTVQGKDGETAGTESEQKHLNVCPECHSSDLIFGSRDPCEGDYYWCNACGFGPILFPLYHVMPLTDRDLEELDSIVREDRADRVRADKENEEPIIDAETCNAALSLRAMADAIEPGFDARAWLEARRL